MTTIGQHKYLETAHRWGPGPWNAEPDEVVWDIAPAGAGQTQYLCVLLRSSATGAWHGYVGLPEHHPWMGCAPHYPDVKVHGGLTHPGGYELRSERNAIWCASWWIGFDCAHAEDRIPADHPGRPGGTYRTMSFAKNECELLAAQASARELEGTGTRQTASLVRPDSYPVVALLWALVATFGAVYAARALELRWELQTLLACLVSAVGSYAWGRRGGALTATFEQRTDPDICPLCFLGNRAKYVCGECAARVAEGEAAGEWRAQCERKQ